MVKKAALYPPACPTRVKKSRLVIPMSQSPHSKRVMNCKRQPEYSAVWSGLLSRAACAANGWRRRRIATMLDLAKRHLGFDPLRSPPGQKDIFKASWMLNGSP
jgi:hypothetical protein